MNFDKLFLKRLLKSKNNNLKIKCIQIYTEIFSSTYAIYIL